MSKSSFFVLSVIIFFMCVLVFFNQKVLVEGNFLSNGQPVITKEGKIYKEMDWTKFSLSFDPTMPDSQIVLVKTVFSIAKRGYVAFNPGQVLVAKYGFGKVWIDFTEICPSLGVQEIICDGLPDVNFAGDSLRAVWAWEATEEGWQGGYLKFCRKSEN